MFYGNGGDAGCEVRSLLTVIHCLNPIDGRNRNEEVDTVRAGHQRYVHV